MYVCVGHWYGAARDLEPEPRKLTRTHTYTHSLSHTHTHVHTLSHTHTHTHAHTHTPTQAAQIRCDLKLGQDPAGAVVDFLRTTISQEAETDTGDGDTIPIGIDFMPVKV